MTSAHTTTSTSGHASSARPIIVGVDGSPSSVAALSWAVRQAEIVGSRVHAVIAWQYPVVYGMYGMSEEIDWAANAQETIDVAVKQAIGSDTDIVTTYVVEGHPAQVLVDASAEADLLVVGNRGHGGFVQALLGSVSEAVVAHASCPVLVLRSRASSESATEPSDGGRG